MHKGFFIILVWGLIAIGDTAKATDHNADQKKPQDTPGKTTAEEILKSVEHLKSKPDFGSHAENLEHLNKIGEYLSQLDDSERAEFLNKHGNFLESMMEAFTGLRKDVINSLTFTRSAGQYREDLKAQLDGFTKILEIGNKSKNDPKVKTYLEEVAEVRNFMGKWREINDKLADATNSQEKQALEAQLRKVESEMLKSEKISKEWINQYKDKFAQARVDRQKKESITANLQQLSSRGGGRISTEELTRIESSYEQIKANLSQVDRDRIENSIDRLRGSATPTSNFANQPQTPSSNGQQANGETGKNSSRGGAGGGGGSSGGSGGAETCIACGKPTNTGSSHSQSGNNSPTGGLTKPNAGGSVSIAGAGSMGGFSGGSSGGGSNSINRAPAQSQPVTFQPPSATIPNGTGTANSGVNGTSSQSPNQGQALSTNGKPSVSNYFFGGVGSGGGSQDLPASKGKLATETGDLSVGKLSEGGNSRRSNGSLAGIAAGGTTTNSSSSNSNSPTPDNSSPTWESGKGPETAANSVKKSKVTPYQWGLAPSDSAPSESSVDNKMNAPEKNTINSKITNEEKNFNQVEKILAGNLPTPRFRPSELKANSGASELGNFTQQALGGGLLASNDPRAPASLGLMKKPNQNRKPTQLAASGSTSSSSLPTSRGFMTSVKSFGKSVFSKLASFFGLK